MQCGKLKTSIEILQQCKVKDAYGQNVTRWDLVCRRLGDVKPAGTKNWVVADRQRIGRQCMVKMREVSQLRETMRLRFGGLEYSIFAVMPDEARHRDVIVHCLEVQDGE